MGKCGLGMNRFFLQLGGKSAGVRELFSAVSLLIQGVLLTWIELSLHDGLPAASTSLLVRFFFSFFLWVDCD